MIGSELSARVAAWLRATLAARTSAVSRQLEPLVPLFASALFVSFAR